MTRPATPPPPPLDLKRLGKALQAVYGHCNEQTAEGTGLTIAEVVEVRAEDVARAYEGRRR